VESEAVARKRSVVVYGVGVPQVVEELVEVALGVECPFGFEYTDDVITGESDRGAVRVLLDEVEVLFSEIK
jgi:hypothetical protein